MKQLDLFINIDHEPFLKYHQDNPHIYEAFKKFTLRGIEMGKKNWSAKAVFEVIRWETGERASGDFKVCNDYTPLYSRLFENEFPQHKGFFRMKVSKFDRVL